MNIDVILGKHIEKQVAALSSPTKRGILQFAHAFRQHRRFRLQPSRFRLWNQYRIGEWIARNPGEKQGFGNIRVSNELGRTGFLPSL